MEVTTRANLVFLARKLLEEEENSIVTEEDFKSFILKLLNYVSVLKKFRVTEEGGEEGEAEGREEEGGEGEDQEGGDGEGLEEQLGGDEGELQYRQGELCLMLVNFGNLWST